MIPLKPFKDYKHLLPALEKLNIALERNMNRYTVKILRKFFNAFEEGKNSTPISYLFSIIAEQRFTTLPPEVVETALEWLKPTYPPAVKLNTTAILGQYLIHKEGDEKKYLKIFVDFISLLNDHSLDVRNNVLYFLEKLREKIKLSDYSATFLEACLDETSPQNIVNLLELFSKTSHELDFDQLLRLRALLLTLLSKSYPNEEDWESIHAIIISIIDQFYSDFIRSEVRPKQSLSTLLKSICLMERVKYPLSSLMDETEQEEYFKAIIERIKKQPLEKELLRFFTKSEHMGGLYVYTIEKDKFLRFFNINDKLSSIQISEFFTPIIDDKNEMRTFMKRLIKLGYIQGYYSKLGFFYSQKPFIFSIQQTLKDTGILNKNNYNHLPPQVFNTFIQQVIEERGDVLLQGIEENLLYSQQKIYNVINAVAKRQNTVDLKVYQDQLREVDFLKVVKNLPKEYYSNYRYKTFFLTTIGKNHIIQELKSSISVGYFNIKEITKKLKIGIEIVKHIIEETVDLRSGFYDREGNVFYYMSFLNNKIDEIQHLSREEERQKALRQLAQKLRIDYSYFSSELNSRLERVKEEILQQDQIHSKKYMNTLGLTYDSFLEFITNLKVDYFIRGEWIIFDLKKIAKVKEEIQKEILNQVSRHKIVHLSHESFKITSSILYQLAFELYRNGKMKGVFYDNGKFFEFYPVKIIREYMIKNQFHFTFHELVPKKDFSQLDNLTVEVQEFIETKEQALLTEIMEKLIEDEEIEGTFDEENLSFSSFDWTFARTYEDVVQRCAKMIAPHFQKFEQTHATIKEVLLNKKKALSPKAGDIIETEVKKIQSQFEKWRSDIYGLLADADEELFNKKTLKKLKDVPKGIRRVQDDPHVSQLLQKFESWTRLINDIEVKYGSIIYYQKWLEKYPKNEEAPQKVDTLYKALRMK